MKITVHNMGFGEQILLSGLNNCLVVDCGSRNDPALAARTLENTLRSPIFENRQVLITHFDSDHYNGFFNFCNSGILLNKLYLPYYLYLKNPETDESGRVYKGAIATAVYLFLLGRINPLTSLHKLFTSICTAVKNTQIFIHNIIPLHEEMNFCFDNAEYKVVWPAHKEDNDFKLYSFANNYNKKLHRIISEGFNQTFEEVDNYLLSISDIYKSFGRDNYEGDYVGENYRDTIVVELVKKMEKLQADYAALEKLSEKTNGLAYLNLNLIKNAQYNYLCSMNACSTIFEEDRVLFTGDATKKVIDLLRQRDRIKEHYEIVKVPHHGTSRHHSSDLPTANHYIVSNAGDAYINWVISGKYSSHFPKGEVHCSNVCIGRCNLGTPCTNCAIPAHLSSTKMRLTF